MPSSSTIFVISLPTTPVAPKMAMFGFCFVILPDLSLIYHILINYNFDKKSNEVCIKKSMQQSTKYCHFEQNEQSPF